MVKAGSRVGDKDAALSSKDCKAAAVYSTCPLDGGGGMRNPEFYGTVNRGASPLGSPRTKTRRLQPETKLGLALKKGEGRLLETGGRSVR